MVAPGDTVLVREGVYGPGTTQLVKSGAPGNPITYKNYPGETPQIWPMFDEAKGFLIQGNDYRSAVVSWLVIEGFEITNAQDGIKMYNADNVIIRNNYIHDVYSQGILGNGYRVTVDRNLIVRSGKTNGNPTSNLEHGVYGTGEGWVVTNNVFIDNQAYGVQVAGYPYPGDPFPGPTYFGARDWLISNNTFAFHSVRGPIVLWQPDTLDAVIQNNIFYRNAKYDVDLVGAGGGHVYRSNLSDRAPIMPGNNLVGDPGFVDPNGFDFRLETRSPAIDEGTAEGAPIDDFEGLLRPGRVDLGAFEHVECPRTPEAGCKATDKSVLLIRDRDGDGAGPGDKVVWRWINGPSTATADFGDPVNTADYALCIYAGVASDLILEVNVPAGGLWSPTRDRGYRYTDPFGVADGISRVVLRSSDAGRTRLVLVGTGEVPLGRGTLPLDATTDVVIQLRNSETPSCWESTYPAETISRSKPELFRARTR